jgi:hypothetical protein
MRFMMIVKASPETEAGNMPESGLIAEMTRFNEEMHKAGVLIDAAGLRPSGDGARVRFANGERMVIEGPFANTRELIAGYWLIQVSSRQEAIEWALRAPNPQGPGRDAEIELRPMFEAEDFGDCEAVEQARELAARVHAATSH